MTEMEPILRTFKVPEPSALLDGLERMGESRFKVWCKAWRRQVVPAGYEAFELLRALRTRAGPQPWLRDDVIALLEKHLHAGIRCTDEPQPLLEAVLGLDPSTRCVPRGEPAVELLRPAFEAATEVWFGDPWAFSGEQDEGLHRLIQLCEEHANVRRIHVGGMFKPKTTRRRVCDIDQLLRDVSEVQGLPRKNVTVSLNVRTLGEEEGSPHLRFIRFHCRDEIGFTLLLDHGLKSLVKAGRGTDERDAIVSVGIEYRASTGKPCIPLWDRYHSNNPVVFPASSTQMVDAPTK